ncbi:hypothetical protein VDG1235_1996 [Verrucomicrobiia bacterium DG1235]|nr:hypothetical protein VDG1235_1996 [Verrucomicrobiae bacterium DG1235]
MKIAAIIVASLNTLPLGVWFYIAIPLFQIVRKDVEFGDSAMSHFCGYGFLWGALLYPVILIFNHVFFLRNYLRQAYRAALTNQLITLAYLFLVLIYALIAHA